MLPIEFYLLGCKFHDWSIVDTISFHELLSFKLTTDWIIESTRELFTSLFNRELADKMILNNGEMLFENTTILDDEDLKLMHIFENFTESDYVKNPEKVIKKYNLTES